jgi:hypothetical protein
MKPIELKMNFELELKREYEDRKKSLENYFSNNIEKSVISDLSYQEDFNKVSVKGKEIRQKLAEQKGMTVSSLAHCVSKLRGMVEEIGVQPQEMDSYGILRYSYSQIYPQDNDGGCQKMREYNEKIYKIQDLKRDLDSVNLMFSNIKDEKDYKLPLHIASQLGL